MPVSTRTFDFLVEQTRSHLPVDVIVEAYLPLDEGGMTFITLKELSREQFQSFERAVDFASIEYRVACTGEHNSAWHELTKRLAKDPRSLK